MLSLGERIKAKAKRYKFEIITFLYLNPNTKTDLVAQPVEQLTLNQWVESSILSQVTLIMKA